MSTTMSDKPATRLHVNKTSALNAGYRAERYVSSPPSPHTPYTGYDVSCGRLHIIGSSLLRGELVAGAAGGPTFPDRRATRSTLLAL